MPARKNPPAPQRSELYWARRDVQEARVAHGRALAEYEAGRADLAFVVRARALSKAARRRLERAEGRS